MALHKNAMPCPICQQMFFPSSMKFHVKACKKVHSLTASGDDFVNDTKYNVTCYQLKIMLGSLNATMTS